MVPSSDCGVREPKRPPNIFLCNRRKEDDNILFPPHELRCVAKGTTNSNFMYWKSERWGGGEGGEGRRREGEGSRISSKNDHFHRKLIFAVPFAKR